MTRSKLRRRGKSALILGSLACFSSAGVHLWTDTTFVDSESAYRRRQQSSDSDPNIEEVVGDDHLYQHDHVTLSNTHGNFTICGRATSFPKALSPTFLEKGGKQYEQWSKTCSSQFNPDTPTLVLEGYETFGRTGNHLRTFLNALQLVRDANYQLAIMYNSWAMGVIVQFFFASKDANWEKRVEEALCIKIIHDVSELQGWRVVLKDTKSIFRYHSLASPQVRRVGQLRTLRTLFANYNTGEGLNQFGDKVKDMCSGINYFFGERQRRKFANYTVIHLRYLEGPPGLRILGNVAKQTGCDPVAALQMSPSYVKSILEPLDMLNKPIVIIKDGQSADQLNGLMADPDLGPQIRLLPSHPDETSWFGGDVMLAVMANVFIGNPASTMSGFIARSRVALGFEGSNYLYRAKDEHGQWATVCGDDCLFDIIDLPDQESTSEAEATKKTITSSSVPNKDSKEMSVYKVERQIIPTKPRVTMKQLLHEKASIQASQELKELARRSRVYTGLHPDDLSKKIRKQS